MTFAEEESVPQDAEKVGTTWRYVNKNGGPDKRFKDNFEIPIMAYEAIQFGSATGLNERIQVSLVGPGTEFLNKVRTMGSAEM